METKICPECELSYSPTRSDQQYCDATCRWNAWRKRKEKQKTTIAKPLEKPLEGVGQTCNTVKQNPPQIPEEEKGQSSRQPKEQEKKPDTDFSEGLRGVVDTSIKMDDTDGRNTSLNPALKSLVKPAPGWIYVKQETPQYKEAAAKKAEIENYGKHVLEVLQKCDIGIQLEEETLRQLTNETSDSVFKNLDWNVDMEALAETDETQRQWDIAKQQEESRIRLTKLNKHKENLLKELDKSNRGMNIIMNRIKTIPRFKTVIKKKPVKLSMNLLDGIKPLPDKPKEQNETKQNEIKTKQPEVASSHIISSRELSKRDYQRLKLQGRWNDFFGQTSTNFHCVVHGKPGEGKSTFCIQFAHYLAKNHGRTIYISGEEGFEKTLRDKIVQNNAITEGLDISDIKNFEELIKEIPPDTFHFIFLDSLDNMRIDAAKMKEIRERYRKSALITISQSTKGGKMRGSQELAHDSDIEVEVKDGIATTTKNRFKPKYLKFQVFDNPKPEK